MEKVYNKLIRDNIPQIINKNNQIPVIRHLSDDEFKIALEKKLYEEYQEVINASSEERPEELADLLEVIISLAKLENCNLEDIIQLADEKRKKRGGFEKHILLERVIDRKN